MCDVENLKWHLSFLWDDPKAYKGSLGRDGISMDVYFMGGLWYC